MAHNGRSRRNRAQTKPGSSGNVPKTVTPQQLPLVPADSTSASATAANNRPKPELFVALFFGFLMFPIGVLPMTGVELNWKWPILIYAGVTVGIVWTFVKTLVPHKERRLRWFGGVVVAVICVAGGAILTFFAYKKQHEEPKLNAAEQAALDKAERVDKRIAEFEQNLNRVVSSNQSLIAQRDALSQLSSEYYSSRLYGEPTNWEQELRSRAKKRMIETTHRQELAHQQEIDAYENNYRINLTAFEYAIDQLYTDLEKEADVKHDTIDVSKTELPSSLPIVASTNIVVEDLRLINNTNWSFQVTLNYGMRGYAADLVIRCRSGSVTVQCTGGVQNILVAAYNIQPTNYETDGRNNFKGPIDIALGDLFEGNLVFLEPSPRP